MSIGTYPTPFSSTAPIPLQPVQDVRDQLWSYRLQPSLETNWSSPPFIHQPYYLPFSALDAGFTAPPFLISALHYFEWRSEVHHYPLIIVQIHISPAFSFNTPVVHIVRSPSTPVLLFIFSGGTFQPLFPSSLLTIFKSTIPSHLTTLTFLLVNSTTSILATSGLSPLTIESPPLFALPHTPANPYTIPLVSHK